MREEGRMDVTSVGRRTWGQTLSLRMRLFLGYLPVFLSMIVVAYVIISQFGQLLEANQRLAQQTEAVIAAEEFARASQQLVLLMDEGILGQNREEMLEDLEPATEAFNESYAYLQTVLDPVPVELDFAVANLRASIDSAITKAETGSWDLLVDIRTTRMAPRLERISSSIDTMTNRALVDQEGALRGVEQTRERMVGIFVITLVLTVVTSGAAAYGTLRSVGHAADSLVVGAGRLAAGDLDHRVSVSIGGQFQRLADTFNQMAGQLRELYTGLESLIDERTAELEDLARQMQASAEVGRAASTVLDPEDLQHRVVELVSERLGFYHAGLFLLDETEEHAELRAASSEGGQRMLERHHRLPVGEGVVGRVVKTGEPYVASDVMEDATWVPNPDLPNTRAELALPLRARDRTLGALDVQRKEARAFTDENVAALQTMADQVAMALDNARLYQQAQLRLREVQRLYGEYDYEAWTKFVKAQPRSRYRYTDKVGEREESDGDEVMVVPLKVRNQVVGKMKLRKPTEGEGWTADERTLVETLVNQMGPTLESVRLLEETQRRAEREQSLSVLSARMARAFDVDTLLRSAVRDLRQILDMDEVAIYMEPPSGEDEAWDGEESA
jgi:GAF domain-containing protein